jgi:hypothetical protein
MLNQNMNNRDREPWSPKHERKTMNNKFDELTKSLAQSVTRRAAFKKFDELSCRSFCAFNCGFGNRTPTEDDF